jgi:hypothetical protein
VIWTSLLSPATGGLGWMMAAFTARELNVLWPTILDNF